jgi:hypothetical protein
MSPGRRRDSQNNQQSTFGGMLNASQISDKAMLLRAVAAVKVDKTKALDMFNKVEGGFLDCDLAVLRQCQRREDSCGC